MSYLENMEERLSGSGMSLEPGSFASDNIRAVAAELERLKTEVADKIPGRIFPTLAEGDDLTLAAENFGVTRKAASNAEVVLRFTGEPGAVITEDTCACADELVYKVVSGAEIPLSGSVSVNAVCTEPGKAGNVPAGAINELAASYAGIEEVINDLPAYGGNDEETDGDLRMRVISRWNTPGTGGSRGDYLAWALEVPGVRRARVFNPSAGNVTVYVVGTADSQDVYRYIEERRPIGASVTVLDGVPVNVGISARIKKDSLYTLEEIEAAIEERIEKYLDGLAFSSNTVSYARLAECLFADGVTDILSYSLNGDTDSLELDDDEYAVLNSLTVTL